MFEVRDEELIDGAVDQQSENSKSFEPSHQIPPKSKYHPAWKRNRIHHQFDSAVFCLRALCSFHWPNLLQCVCWLCNRPTPKEVRGSSPVRLPCTPLLVFSWPQLCSRSRQDDRAAEEFLCPVPKPTCQDALFRLSTFLSYVPADSHMAPLCWNMTFKYQTLPLVTSPNTVHLRADASGKCLSLPQQAAGTWQTGPFHT